MSKKNTSHFTPAFRRAFKKVEKAEETLGHEEARKVFRDEMLKLGHNERCRNLYRVKDKLSQKAVFFVPNQPQEDFLKTRKGRDAVLKIRQVGFTTVSGIEGLDYALWEENMSTGIMAHQQNVVATIFEDIVKFSYTWFQRDWGALYAPVEKSDSKTALVFEQDGLGRPLNSSMRVLFDFMSKTVNFLHVSEAAFIEDKRLLKSLQSVPANGKVVLESTPNGRAGDFYQQWQNWKSLGSLAPYQGFFIPWFKFYPEEPENWQLPEGTQLTPYEQELLEFGQGEITEAHIAWRRWCIATNCQGDVELFENQYPTNDRDCFLTGAAMVFPSNLLKLQEKHCRPPSKQGFLLSDGGVKTEFHPDGKGIFAIWEDPDPTHSYVIGADPSGGVGKDRGAAYVLDQQTGRFVARLWGQLDPNDFALELYKLGVFYNKAWICVETNNHGHLVLHVLTTKHYKNLYKRRVIDELTNQPTNKVGFLTTNESKITITEKFKAACKNGKITIFDQALINEMSSFVQLASSKNSRSIRREASPGAHDDLVMCACFAEEMNSVRLASSPEREPLEAPTPERSSNADSDTGFSF